MATISDLRSANATLTSTTADLIQLTQFWDTIEITNLDATDPLYVRFDGTTAASGAEGAMIVPPAAAKVFGPGDGITNESGVPGSTTAATVCHWVSIVGDANGYSVEGHAGS